MAQEAAATNRQEAGAEQEDYTLRDSLRLLARLIKPYRRLALATAVALIFDMTGMLYVPTELSAMINAALSPNGSTDLLVHGVRMLMASICGSGGAITAIYLASKLAANVGRDMRMAVYEASLAYSGSDFERFGTGSMITRTLSDANVVQQTLAMGIIMILPVPVMSVIAVGLAFSIDAVMGWLLLTVTLAVVAVSVVTVKVSAPIFTRLQAFIDRMNVRLRETITGVRVVRAFGREEVAKRELDRTFSDYADNAIRVNLMFSTADSLTFFLMNGVEVLVIWLGADRVGMHAMQIGSITALIEYAMLIMFFYMMAQFAMLSVPRALACLGRASQVVDLAPEVGDPATAAVLGEGGAGERASAHAEVARFDHVSFRFHDADEDTLHDLDFSLRRGETCAIIGNTGSGKSTIAKMLLRFHDVTAGRLLFGGVDVRELTQADLRARISYVPQKAWLFSGTIAENLRHGDAYATDEHLWHAVDTAQGAFVHELPEGLATRVSQGGTNFSGGQRQRLAIARALVRRADLYIFDDSFSALDFKTDAALRHALKDELKDAAVLIIAQRVSTIAHADQIVVLNEGEVVGVGTHEQLMEECPTYRAIADSQARKEESHV